MKRLDRAAKLVRSAEACGACYFKFFGARMARARPGDAIEFSAAGCENGWSVKGAEQ